MSDHQATSRELVVFLPAVGGDSTFWRPQIEALQSRYEVLALDLARPASEVSMAGFAEDVARAIEAKGYGRAHLVGLSMGGVVALELYRKYPERIASLCLANTWAYQAEADARLGWAEEQFAKMSLPAFSRMSLPGLFAPDTDRALVEHGVSVESAKDYEMYKACWRTMLRADLRDVLPYIDVPVLLIGGSLDPVTPTDPLLTLIKAAVPAAVLLQIEGASHFSNLDKPEDFTRALVGHLRAARERRGGAAAREALEDIELPQGSTAEQLLRLLSLRGVELFASNSGTDFTPLIDALSLLQDDPAFRLRVVAAPHENTAVAMAHGYALLARRPQVVMGHVGVGTANMGLGIMNARRARVPMLVMAGKSPWYESGAPGVRSNFVQWGQDTFDQAAYFREFTKWDYELKGPHALDTVVDRALAVTESDPQAPVYLTLPKEPLCQPAEARRTPRASRLSPSKAGPADSTALEAARRAIQRAKSPLIITADLGRHAGGAAALSAFALAAGAGVIEHGKRNFFNLPTDHPHHLGFDPLPHLYQADLVIAVECPVPWIPAFSSRATVPQVIQIGVDPLFSDLPMRGFPSDLSLSGDPVSTLRALVRSLGGARSQRPEIAAMHRAIFDDAAEEARAQGERDVITKTHLSHVIGRIIDNDVVIFNEYNLDPLLVPRSTPDSWFENSVASGLGWSLGAALGGAMAAPDKTMVVTLGDGAYLFNTPLSAHYVAQAEGLSLLIIVFNDSAWSTIKKSTKGSHPKGHAARTGRYALCDFPVSVAYEKVVEATGGIGLCVSRPSDLEATLREALTRVRTDKRHVLVNVICERDG